MDATYCTRLLRNHCLWLWLLCMSPGFATADPGIEVVLSSDKSYYYETAAILSKTITRQHPAIELRTTIVNQNSWHADNHRLIVAVGFNACKQILEKIQHTPLLCTFLPRSAYQTLIKQNPETDPNQQRSAIYFDQPMVRYIGLIKTLIPKAKNLGTAVGPQSEQLLPAIQTLATRQNLQLHYTRLDSDSNPVSKLTGIVENSDVFLVNPDRAKLNKTIARWLLHLSIRQRIPVIAYSGNYVSAGALAAIYSSPENIGLDTGETVNQWLNNADQPLAKPRYPNYFTISTNPNVARALGIKLPKSSDLKSRVIDFLITSGPEE